MIIHPSARNQDVLKMLNDYKQFVLILENNTDAVKRSHEWNRGFHAAVGITTEGSEILDIFKKDLYGLNKPITRERVVDESGDLLYYFTLLCAAFNITLEELIDKNVGKLTARYQEKLAAMNEDYGEYVGLLRKEDGS